VKLTSRWAKNDDLEETTLTPTTTTEESTEDKYKSKETARLDTQMPILQSKHLARNNDAPEEELVSISPTFYVHLLRS